LRQAKRLPGRLHTGSQDDLDGELFGHEQMESSDFQMMPTRPTGAILLPK